KRGDRSAAQLTKNRLRVPRPRTRLWHHSGSKNMRRYSLDAVSALTVVVSCIERSRAAYFLPDAPPETESCHYLKATLSGLWLHDMKKKKTRRCLCVWSLEGPGRHRKRLACNHWCYGLDCPSSIRWRSVFRSASRTQSLRIVSQCTRNERSWIPPLASSESCRRR